MKKYRKRSPFTESDRTVMWDRWRQGDSLHAIARLLGASHTSVRRNLLATGGIQPPRNWGKNPGVCNRTPPVSRGGKTHSEHVGSHAPNGRTSHTHQIRGR